VDEEDATKVGVARASRAMGLYHHTAPPAMITVQETRRRSNSRTGPDHRLRDRRRRGVPCISIDRDLRTEAIEG
jgi:hypothetical protein